MSLRTGDFKSPAYTNSATPAANKIYIIMKLYKYTIEQLKDAIGASASLRQTLKTLGVAPYGGNYAVIKRAIKYFALDISHFTHAPWNKGRRSIKRKTLEYLQNQYPISSHKLRKRLITEHILEPKCSNCELSYWLGKPIPLELDHKNGNNKDNSLNNLRLLYPNCHALTPTYRGKNKKKL